MFSFAPNIPDQKAHLRHEMKARRAMLGENERARASWLACDALSAWLQTRSERRIAVFLGRPAEVCLDALARELLREDCGDYIVAAPRVELNSGTMNFCQLTDLSAVQNGPWNVREPVSREAVQPEIVLVPGLAFDECGHRLGTGGGWYDRVLSDDQIKVGVSFAAQIMPRVPVEAHDVKMDWVASDDGLVRCG